MVETAETPLAEVGPVPAPDSLPIGPAETVVVEIDPAEVEAMRDRDPLLVAERQLPRADVAAIREDVEARLAEALEAAEAAPAAGAAKEAVP